MNKIKIAIALAIVVLVVMLAFIDLNNTDNEIKSDSPVEKEDNDIEERPGFEGIFTIAGFLAIAYLVLR